MRHLDEGTIHAWLDGALHEEKARQAEEHAARCTQCAMAVADARGFIAASSRILLALDDVPRGVIPARDRTLPAAAPAAPPKRLIQPWMLKAAASVVVVGTTALLLTRAGTNVPAAARFAVSATDSFAPAKESAESLAASPAESTPFAAGQVAPLANAPLPAADDKSDALLKAKSAESTVVAGRLAETARQEPAAPTAPAAVAAVVAAPTAVVDSLRSDAGLAAQAGNQVASVAPKISVAQSTGAGAPKRAIGGQDAALPPGMRVVSEQTITAQARIIQKRVYEVSPGVEVTYSIFEPIAERDRAAEKAAPGADSAAEAKDEATDDGAGINTIKWSDSTGTDFILSGRLPLDSLRVIRSTLTTVHRQ